MNNFAKTRYILGLFTAAIIVAVIGCESASNVNNSSTTADYVIEGVIVRDLNQANVRSAVKVEKNEKLYAEAVLLFGSDSLEFNHALGLIDSVYSHQIAPDSLYPGTNFNLTINDPGKFTDLLPVALTGPFDFSILSPANQLWRPTDGNLSLDWTGSDMADGYVMAAVKASEAYTGAGYSAYSGEQVTAGTLRADSSFYINAGATVDTGLYNIYIYSFWGSPDKALADQILPTPLPTQLTDNIAEKNVTGHFGAITVTLFDTLRVATQ